MVEERTTAGQAPITISNRNNNNDSQLISCRQNYALLTQLLNITDSHMKPINWKHLYTREDVDLCMSMIKLVDFNEGITLYGAVHMQARSSGHSIGACNWTIEFDADTIVYLSRSSLLNTHSKLFNTRLVKQQMIDTLIVAGLNQAQHHEPEQMIQNFCKACLMTIKNQGGSNYIEYIIQIFLKKF
jgi:Cft2 family RNA processing exonuclease